MTWPNVCTSLVNANSIASKAWKKERWIRGTVISQEGAMVNVHVDNAVNQSKMMNGMMLQFLDLTHQNLFHLQLKMKMTMNQI